MGFFWKLCAICILVSVGLNGILLFLVQFGPIVFFGFIALAIAVASYFNEARKTVIEYDDKIGINRMQKALEEYIEKVVIKRNVEDKNS